MYVSDICVLFPVPAHLVKRGWPRDPHAGFQLFSLPTIFPEEFSLPKSANLTRACVLTGFCISDRPIATPTSLELISLGLKSYHS